MQKKKKKTIRNWGRQMKVVAQPISSPHLFFFSFRKKKNKARDPLDGYAADWLQRERGAGDEVLNYDVSNVNPSENA